MVQIANFCRFVTLAEKLALYLNRKHAWLLCSFVYAIQPHNLELLQEELSVTCPFIKCCCKQTFPETFCLVFSKPCATEYLIPLRRRESQLVEIWYLENTTSVLLRTSVADTEGEMPLWPLIRTVPLEICSLPPVSELHCLLWTAWCVTKILAQKWKK